MKVLVIQHHLTDKQLLNHLNTAKGTDDFVRWQMLYLIQVAGLNNAEQIGTAVGVSKHTVYQLVRSYNKRGIEAIAKKPKGGRRRSLLSIDDEVSLMEELKKMAQSGQIHSVAAIRKHVETKVVIKYRMIIYGTYLTGMAGKRKCQDPVIQNQIKPLKQSLK